MKILLTDNLSIIEYLYRKSLGEEVELTMSLTEATAIVASDYTPVFYNKTLIVCTEKFPSKEIISNLLEVNDIISRVPLEFLSGEDYSLEPYSLIDLKDFKFKSKRNKPISILALKDYMFTKLDNTYYMERSTAYLGTQYKSHNTVIGLIKHQIKE